MTRRLLALLAALAALPAFAAQTFPPACSRLCTVEGEGDVTLTTVSEAYDWFATDQTALDELRGRVTYNLGVRLGMHYGPLESFCSLAELPAALAPYGLDSLHTSVQQGGVVTGQTLSDEALERGV